MLPLARKLRVSSMLALLATPLVAGCAASTPSARGEAVVAVTPIGAHPADPQIARAAALKDAEEFGLVGLIGAEGSTPAPVVDDSKTPSVAGGSASRVGDLTSLFGKSSAIDGLSMGGGGFGLGAVGIGGGGTGEGIGLGSIGRGRTGLDSVPGTSIDVDSTSIIEVGDTVTLGPPLETAIREIRSHIYKLRECFDALLDKNPRAEGTLSLRLATKSLGTVEYVNLYSSTLASPDTESCIKRALLKSYIGRPVAQETGVVETTLSFRPAKK